jgi:hypothetical protein
MPLISCGVCGEKFDWETEKYTWISFTDIDDPDQYYHTKVRMHTQCRPNFPRCSGPCARKLTEIPTGCPITARYTYNPLFEYTCEDCIIGTGEVRECALCMVHLTAKTQLPSTYYAECDKSLCEHCQTLNCILCGRGVPAGDEYILNPRFDAFYPQQIICTLCQKQISEAPRETIIDRLVKMSRDSAHT